MKLRNLSIFEFDEYAKNHPLGNFYQTSTYALVAGEEGYDYDLIGMIDDNNNIVAASVILSKRMGLFNRYGYAPKGFLIDYYNPTLIKEFTKLLKKRYYNKNFAFIKINPEIAIGTVDYKRKYVTYNKNQIIDSTLKGLNFRKLEGTYRFETKFPRFNAIQVLKNTNLKTISKRTRNKIHRSIRNGLRIEKSDLEGIRILYEFIKNKKDKNINHYFNYYNAFRKSDSIDILLVKINFEECLINLRNSLDKEQERNAKLVEKLMKEQSEDNLARKLASDALITTYKNSIVEATKSLAVQRDKYIGGAITIKYKNRVSILISGFDQNYKMFCPNYFLHYMLIEEYKNDYDYLDLNGITGDFSKENPYRGLDEFKLGFNPLTFEYIGEYDLIINEGLYQSMEHSGQLSKEFKRKEKVSNN
ncbi:MAG: peptidoglycan bridge formation glycyltransferase FemA/FemB family protein [Bacilli bacterium]|nr:peptidoglycan bridge formation glycyltransferase FemA/FemB family protein [Bacilli bacterium]